MAMGMTEPVQILIVEDEPLIAMMLEDFLDVLDKQVAGTVDSVDDALARVAEGGIDAAILDVNLRGGQKSTPSPKRWRSAVYPSSSPLAARTTRWMSGSAIGRVCKSRSRWTVWRKPWVRSDPLTLDRARNLGLLRNLLASGAGLAT